MRFEPLPTDEATHWWESPFVLALAGTLAIHIMLAVSGDAIVVLNPLMPDPPPPPKLELVDVELPPVVKPPPPPIPKPEPVQPEIPKPAVHTHVEPVHQEPLPPTPPPPESKPDPNPSGGAPLVSIPDLAPGTTGVAVASGPHSDRVGRGGTGTGTSSATGAGSAAAPPIPMSVATIKTRAMPHGDYSYQETKDYPVEAKQLGIEGKIRVKLIVDDKGVVTSVKLLNSLGHGLDELALKRANLIVFDPARDSDDKPVTSVVVWTFDLTLPK